MSVLNEFKAAEERVRARLAELRPLAEEFHQLEKLAAQFGIKIEPLSASAARSAASAAATTAKQPARRGRSAGRRATAKRASARKTAGRPATASAKPAAAASRRQGATRTAGRRARGAAAKHGGSRRRRSLRSEQLAEIVRKRPGITVREAADEMRVDATSLYRVVRQLEQEGHVKKQGRQLQPA